MRRMSEIFRRIVLSLAVFAVVSATVMAGAAPGGENSGGGTIYNDYEDYRQMPVRNADLVRLMEESELITVVSFDPSAAPAAGADGKAEFKARVVHGPAPGANWEQRLTEFKGKWGKELGDEIRIIGDPKAFQPPNLPELDVKQKFGFVPSKDRFLLFLQPAGDGAYKCHELCPGGMRLYEAIGKRVTDHRTLYVGMVGGKLAVEGGPGYQGHPMCGPTMMLNALRAIRLGASLTAKSAGGAAVDVELKAGGAALTPGRLILAAPALWAEAETPEGDAVLLSPQDYRPPEIESPYVPAKSVQGGVLSGRVELPTGPVPDGAELTWAKTNHRKRLLGSLPEGEHTVRLLCAVYANDKGDARFLAFLISNPVKVHGKAGGATPADLAKLKDATAHVPEESAAKPAQEKSAKGTIDKASLRGEIWFDSNRDGSWDIFVMNADGSDVRNITNTKDKDEFEAKPSPDGKRVVYVVGKLKNAGVWGGRWETGEIWVADRDGKNAKKIADKGSRPAWGPDGKVVAYSGVVDGKGSFVVHNIETGQIIEPLKKVGNWFRDVSGGQIASGTRMVAFGGKLWTQVDAALYSAELDENYQFKGFKPVHTTYRGCTPRWAADGKRIYFAHHDPACKGEIILWVINADGSGARRFETPTRKVWPGYDPFCESPDGTMFAYLSGAGISVHRVSDGADLPLTERKQGVQYGGIWWHKGP